MSAPADPRLTDQPPFVWFQRAYDRAGLPALAWIFILAAIVVGLLPLLTLVGAATESMLIGGFLYAITAAVSVALPAALLARLPDAHRRVPSLFTGLALLALATLLRAALQPLRLGTSVTLLTLDVAFVIEVAGLLLVGIGLLRVRAGATAWQPLLIVLAAAYVIAGLAPPLLNGSLVIDPLILARSLVGTVALAFGHAIPLVAWFDGARPRAFWGLLALAGPVYLLQLAVWAALILLVQPRQPGVWDLATAVASLLSALLAVAALVAYGRYTPRETRAHLE